MPDAAKGLKIESRLNGNVMQSDNTDNMMFPVVETLVYITQGITLEPGDVIFTGTPSGVGHARKPNPVWMKNGDTVEVETQGVGTLRNPIARRIETSECAIGRNDGANERSGCASRCGSVLCCLLSPSH